MAEENKHPPIDGRKISSPPELKELQRRVSKTAFSVGFNREMF